MRRYVTMNETWLSSIILHRDHTTLNTHVEYFQPFQLIFILLFDQSLKFELLTLNQILTQLIIYIQAYRFFFGSD